MDEGTLIERLRENIDVRENLWRYAARRNLQRLRLIIGLLPIAITRPLP